MKKSISEELKLQGSEVFKEDMHLPKTPQKNQDKTDRSGVSML